MVQDQRQDVLKKAYDNLCESWEGIFHNASKNIKPEDEIALKDLYNPYSEITRLLILIFSLETYVYESLNKA